MCPTRAVIIGFDGAEPEMLLPWIEEGELPTFKSFFRSGVSGRLKSTIPPISPAAWVTFLTGKNPGNHGIFGFNVFSAENYIPEGAQLTDSRAFAGTTVLDLLGQRGFKVCSLAMPMTYPVWPINGVMLAGIPAPDNSKAYTYPPGLDFGTLTPYPYHKGLTADERVAHIEYEARKRTEILCRCLDDGFDFCTAVLHSPDTAHHYFWRFMDPGSPLYTAEDNRKYGDVIFKTYKLMDEMLAEILRHIGPDTLVVLMSDHGGALRPRRQVHFNSWLNEEGWLSFKASVGSQTTGQRTLGLYEKVLKPLLPLHIREWVRKRHGWLFQYYWGLKFGVGDIDWSRTEAYLVQLGLPACGIEINLRGRQPEGCVEPEEYEGVREAIIHRLQDLRDPESGEPIVLECFRKEALYTGRFVSHAPDIVFILHPDYQGDPQRSPELVTRTPSDRHFNFSGIHSLYGFFAIRGPSLRKGCVLEGAEIGDLIPTVLYALDQPIPREMDGRILLEAFEPGLRETRQSRYSDSPQPTGVTPGSYTAEEEQQMVERLRGLGYLD